MKESVSAQQFFFMKNAHIWTSSVSLLWRYYPFEKLDSYQVIACGKSEGEGDEYTCQLIDAGRRGYRRWCYLIEEQRRSDTPEKADGKSIP